MQQYKVNGQLYEFPDDMGREEIRQQLKRRDPNHISIDTGPTRQSQVRYREPQYLFPMGKNPGETRAAKELPELFTSGLLNGEDSAQVAKFSAIAALTFDPQELSRIATKMFPNIGAQQDEGGNIILANNKTGATAIINRPGFSTTDAAQTLGIIPAFTPAGFASKQIMGQGLKKGLKESSKVGLAAGATQTAIEGAQVLGGGEFDSGNIAVAAAAGPTVQAGFEKFIAPILTNVFSKIAGKRMNILDDTGQISEEAIEEITNVMEQNGIAKSTIDNALKKELQVEGLLTPQQAERFNLFARREVPAARANITQSTDDFRQLKDAEKSSGIVSERIAEQDARLFQLAREGSENIGPTTQNLAETNASVFGVVDDVVTELDNVIFKAYTAARESAKGQPRVTLDNLLKSVNDNRGSENITKGVISSIRGVLRNKGIFKKGKSLDINKRGARLSEIKKITVNEAEEVRQSLNELFESTTPQGRRLIRKFKDAIDDDVARVVGDDIFKEARQAKIKFQTVIEKGKRNKFDKTRGSFLENVIDNKVPEDKIVQKLLTSRDDEFLAMRRFLLEDSGSKGIQAYNNIKAQVIRNAMDKATTQAKGEGGQAFFNARLFRNAFKSLRQQSGSKKFDLLFNADEKQLIDDIVEIGRLRVPIRSVAIGSGPSGAAIAAAKTEINKTIMRQIPLIGEKAQGIVDAVGGKKAVKTQLDPLKGTERTLNTQDIKNALENIKFLSVGAGQLGNRY